MSESKQNPVQKSALREWWDSILFAVVAATLIRWLIFDPYTIPTPSMESSLMVGDFLFVSRVHYGTRTPRTPLQVPLTHQNIWLTKIPSYSELVQLPIFRLPGFSSVKNNDVVVFNYPGDYGKFPVDLRTNYIKRCIAIAGDVLEVRNQQAYINGKPAVNAPRMQQEYYLKTDQLFDDAFFRQYDIINDYRPATTAINWQPVMEYDSTKKANIQTGYRVNTSSAVIESLKKLPWCKEVREYSFPKEYKENSTYPQSELMVWNRDNFGPLQVPKEGQTITLDAENIAKYGQVIEKYESNKDVIVNPLEITIEGKVIKTYTFKQNYYFMMGDNRHNSEDSRYWGFVPEDHIVGKAVFVWLSIESNYDKWYNFIRWNRVFRFIN
jgi:signal peptidase I